MSLETLLQAYEDASLRALLDIPFAQRCEIRSLARDRFDALERLMDEADEHARDALKIALEVLKDAAQ